MRLNENKNRMSSGNSIIIIETNWIRIVMIIIIKLTNNCDEHRALTIDQSYNLIKYVYSFLLKLK